MASFFRAQWLMATATIALVAITSAADPPKFDVAAAAAKVKQVIAHRGARTERPENTLASTRRAIEVGATAVEVDVRTTKDGHLVLMHDANLDHTTTGTGPLNQTTFSDLRLLDAGTKFDPKFRGQQVPTLAEALTECRGKIDVLLDLKESGDVYDQKVIAEIKAQGEPARTIVGVRSVEQARAFRRLLPQARQLGLIAKPEEIEAYAAAGVEMIRLWPRWLTDATLVGKVRKSGAKLHLNGEVGTPEEIIPLLAHGPDSLSSDDPRRLLATLEELRGPDSRVDDEPGFTSLFDGRTLAGWQGDAKIFRVENGAIVAGSPAEKIARNEFLASTDEFGDFELRLKARLVGAGQNAGVQFRSQRIPDHFEMVGYQCDMGIMQGRSIWGALYDESRRRKFLIEPNGDQLAKVVKEADWNDLVVRCEGPRVQIWVNGLQTVDYTEQQADIPRSGRLALQIHGGQPAEASYKNIRLRRLDAK